MFGDGTTSCDYTYVDDIINGVLAAFEMVRNAQRTEPGQAGELPSDGFFRLYNLGGSHPVTLAEMIDTIAKVVGKPARIRPMPTQPGDVERTWADLTRSTAELRYRVPTEFIDGVRLHWHWLRESMTPMDSVTSTCSR